MRVVAAASFVPPGRLAPGRGPPCPRRASARDRSVWERRFQTGTGLRVCIPWRWKPVCAYVRMCAPVDPGALDARAQELYQDWQGCQARAHPPARGPPLPFARQTVPCSHPGRAFRLCSSAVPYLSGHSTPPFVLDTAFWTAKRAVYKGIERMVCVFKSVEGSRILLGAQIWHLLLFHPPSYFCFK